MDNTSYNHGYEEGYKACENMYRERAKARKQTKIENRRHQLYFLKQKLIGVFMLILTVFAIWMLEGDATVAVVTVPIGMILIFSKKKCWMDNYYFETERDDIYQ